MRSVGLVLDCTKKRMRLPPRYWLRDLKGFGRLIWRMGVRRPYRAEFWKTLAVCGPRNPRGLRYAIALMALYLHFGEFRDHLLERLDLEYTRWDAAPRVSAVAIEARQGDVHGPASAAL